ncbi:SNF2 family N-terminal domain-containing protein [Colletotrichum phormii]|uniref:SNF2 family N-terminal domain-containing protein n=1 Tax=Colletotrichum phormii TaxID=359342 RepID=A0AAI9ZEE6_9PEZI|nr:SNF2 family N-terminal domain-containing protein [Colletotrichum phormii]KAK1622708.1 SNF2 family N-terminal domain-containing protein [Colletotrichum phormii]
MSADISPANNARPLRISFFDKFVMLHNESNSALAAVVHSEALSCLARECFVTLVATMEGPKSQNCKLSVTNTRSWNQIPVCLIRFVVHGLLSEKEHVTRILDAGELYLQRPDSSEYDVRVRYFNPMYLVPTGKDIPERTEFRGSLIGNQTTTSFDEFPLGEVIKDQVQKVFDEPTVSSLVLPLNVKQSSRIITKLKCHQVEALNVMVRREHGDPNIDTTYPSLWEKCVQEKETTYRHAITGFTQAAPLPSVSGGILADEMGLGKTLSTLALICHHLDKIPNISSCQTDAITRVSLVVAPKSTIFGWQHQIETHIKPGKIRSLVFLGPTRHQFIDSLPKLDVVLTTYDTLRSDWMSNGPLYNFTWARVILDEAHKIRNCSTKTFLAASALRARSRWCLTGTPIQNSLDDFGSLLAFIRVPPFTSRDQFRFWISSPIMLNQQRDMKQLRKLVAATCLRRTKLRLNTALNLPKKTEHIEVVDMTSEERCIYDFFMKRSYLLAHDESKTVQEISACDDEHPKKRQKKTAYSVNQQLTTRSRSGQNPVVLISILRLICDHGEALLPTVALEAWQNREPGKITWDFLQTTAEKDSDDVFNVEEAENATELQDAHTLENARKSGADGGSITQERSVLPIHPAIWTGEEHSHTKIRRKNVGQKFSPSSKVSAVLRNILHTLPKGDSCDNHSPPVKSVIFSSWIGMLDLIGSALIPHLYSYNLTYARLDGSCDLQQRRNAIIKFRNDDRCVVLLATVGAAGEGINLTVASEVHIVEPLWNPMAEVQAIDRVHRMGQTREVKVMKYCVKHSIEEASF